jgi:hypothetical protein
MPVGGERNGRRASWVETVGAWLRLWTPPRDVEVPPVPVRALAIGGVAALAVVVAATAFVAPRIDDSKDRAAAAEQRERDARRLAERERIRAEQRARRADAAGLRPGPGATDAEQRAARAALVARAEREIGADARQRAADGELKRRPGATECDPYPPRDDGERPEQDLSVRRGTYDCLVLVRAIEGTERNVGGRLGYPFRAVLDFEAFRIAWCKTNPIPGERVVPDPRYVVELPRACRRSPN